MVDPALSLTDLLQSILNHTVNKCFSTQANCLIATSDSMTIIYSYIRSSATIL